MRRFNLSITHRAVYRVSVCSVSSGKSTLFAEKPHLNFIRHRCYCTDSKSQGKGEANKCINEGHNLDILFVESLRNVPVYGWSEDSLILGAQKLNYPKSIVNSIEEPGFSILKFHIDSSNYEFAEKLRSKEFEVNEMTLNQKLFVFIKKRLEYNIPYMNRWAEALSLILSPSSLPESLSLLVFIVEQISSNSADTGTSVNWYMRRLWIMSIYSSTELYMVTDASPNYEDTWKFLQRRIDDLNEFYKYGFYVRVTD